MAHAAKHVVTDRKKSTAKVLRVVKRFARSTARKLRKRMAQVLTEGEEMPDLVLLQHLMARVLERQLRLLVDADAALRELLAQDVILRQQRDAAVKSLYREVGDARSVFEGQMGREAARKLLGLKGETSRDPAKLLRQADYVVTRLRDHEHQPGGNAIHEPVREHRARSVADAADALRPLDRRARESAKELDAAGLERRRALADNDDTFVRISNWFEKTYRVIGRDDLADAVRPSKKYPGRTAEEMKEPPEPAVETEGRLLSFDPLRHLVSALGFGGKAAAGGD